ncbi:MAG: translation elongation factor Ts [Sedimentisphaerales bacterium]|nr:translation elongation factor Ts [Sedimentisphaerales bacterium]
MAEITTALVVKLRKISGQGMMDCKKALEESGGNIDDAMSILRKKGLATLAKRAERETTQGLVVNKISGDGRMAVLVSLCCETDFVANSKDFGAAAEKLVEYALVCNEDEGVENLLETAVGGKKFRDVVTELVSKTGEKTEVGDYAKFKMDGTGLICSYVHFNRKVGTMLQIDASDDKTAGSEQMKRTGADIAMHITATKPLALDKNGIAPDVIEREKSIYAEQVKSKPANIVDKIVEGKMKKFFEENCLLEQKFVKDDTKTVAQVLGDAAKQTGGSATIKRFVRFDVG